MRAGRAAAVLDGREYVTPDDIKDRALPVLRHRVTLAPELEVEGRTTDDVISAVLTRIAAPV
jgi:MoxR-like ATPase